MPEWWDDENPVTCETIEGKWDFKHIKEDI